MRYFECPKCGLFTSTSDRDPLCCSGSSSPVFHVHGTTRYAVQELHEGQYWMAKYASKGSQMKTCETCKGTGQVAEPINVSDLVSINVRMAGWGWTGVGVITKIGPIYVDVLMVSVERLESHGASRPYPH